MEEAKSDNRDNKLEANLQTEVTQLILMLPDLLSILFGKKLSPDVRQQLSDFTKMALPQTTEFLGELAAIQTIENKPSQFIALYKAADVFLRSVITDVPSDKLALDYLIENLEARTTLPPAGYLAETSYVEYRRLLSELAQEVCSKTPRPKVHEYLDSVYSAHDDMLSVGQSFVIKLPNQYKALTKVRKHFTRKAAEQYIAIYGELAGQFEKGIAIVVGLIELLQNHSPKYLSIRKRRLATNLKKVEQSSCSILASNFDRSMRNAMMHGTRFFNPVKNSVQFYGPGKKRAWELTYREIARKTKELSALVLALHQLPTILAIEQLRSFKGFVRRLEGQEPNFDSPTESR